MLLIVLRKTNHVTRYKEFHKVIVWVHHLSVSLVEEVGQCFSVV